MTGKLVLTMQALSCLRSQELFTTLRSTPDWTLADLLDGKSRILHPIFEVEPLLKREMQGQPTGKVSSAVSKY